MRPFCALLVVALLAVCGRGAIAAELRMGPTRIAQGLPLGDSVVVTVDVVTQNRSFPWADRMWGSERGYPVTRHVSDLRIRWGRRKVDVWLSAYADLGDPRSIKFVEVKKGISLQIQGGETATDYEAQFFVENGVLVHRRVSLGELPEQSWEKTRYSGPVIEK